MRTNRLHTGILIPAVFLCLLFSVTFPVAAQSEADPAADAKVYVIPLREDVDRYLGVFLGRSIETARDAGAEVILLEIDTFGGRVDTALEIASRIGSASWARTVAYVPSDSGGKGVSWSAGALMAFSASELWMSPGTSMGAAAPVYQTSEGMQAAEEKTVSAVRGQMAALAEKNGYPIGVALAMVDADVVLTEVSVDGEIVLATTEDIAAMKREGKVPEVGRTLSGEGKLLTLTAGEMERYGVSSGTVATRDELVRSLGYSPDDVRVLEKNRADSILTLLTSGGVTGLLLIAGLVALYLEITSPGFGVPGTIALICFAIVFSASGLMGNLGPFEILMFILGVALLLLEIFVIPGFGVAGIAGIILIFGAFVFSMQTFYWPEFAWQWTLVRRNLAIVGASVLGGLGVIAVLMNLMPRSGLFDRLVLHDPDDPRYAAEGAARTRRRRELRNRRNKQNAAGSIGGSGESAGVRVPVSGGTGPMSSPVAVGDRGLALTDLRPVGKVRFGNISAVAETDGEYCEKGSQVVVLRMDGVKIVVAEEEK